MIHHIYANRSNVGDWLSAMGIQELIAPMGVVEHLCDEPFREATIGAIAAAGLADAVVVGGGGLFSEYFAPFWTGLLGVLGSRPLAIWGVGVCDHVQEDSLGDLAIYRNAVQRARLAVPRDERTRTLIGTKSFQEPVLCPSLNAVPQRAPGERRGVLHVAHFDLVGEDFYHSMVDACSGFADRTKRTYRETNNRIRDDRKDDLERCLDLYASSDLVVSSRLHGCILGLAQGCRVLAVAGDRKIPSFMQQLGLSDWVIEPGDGAALDAALARLEQQPDVSAALERARHANQVVAARVQRLAGYADTHA